MLEWNGILCDNILMEYNRCMRSFLSIFDNVNVKAALYLGVRCSYFGSFPATMEGGSLLKSHRGRGGRLTPPGMSLLGLIPPWHRGGTCRQRHSLTATPDRSLMVSKETINGHKHLDIQTGEANTSRTTTRSARPCRLHPNLGLFGGVAHLCSASPSAVEPLYPSAECESAPWHSAPAGARYLVFFFKSTPRLAETLLHLYFCIFLYHYGCFHPLFSTLDRLGPSEREAPHASRSSCFAFLCR